MSPFPSLKIAVRVFAKAIALLIALNVLCLALQFEPVRAVTQFNTWWMVGHGRARLAYPSDFQNGQLPLEVLLGSHALAYTPKAADEFRVIVLGESGIAGWGLDDSQTFTAQLTAKGLRIGGKRLVAYNLAYPSPSVARDVLILDAALSYQPDLVIWFVTPSALDDSPGALGTNVVFFELNRARLQRITSANGLQSWFDARMTPPAWWQRWVAIRDQDMLPVWVNSLLYPFVAPDLGLSTRRVGSEPIPAKARYTNDHEGFVVLPNDTWRYLQIGRKLAEQNGARLLLVNEPMLIGSASNSQINYNAQYERALYDRVHRSLIDYAAANGFLFADLWDAIPAESFTDTPLHADAAGYATLVERITKELDRVGLLN